jgi:ABC-type phosphate/phosphonate transport system substrate-binding protein
MVFFKFPQAWIVAAILAGPAASAYGQQAKLDLLRIGTSGTLASVEKGGKEEAALETMRDFIKEETGFNNEIIQQKHWRELAQKMADRQLHLGVFQGYEFAWAVEKQPDLKPLAIAVNVYRYPVVYVVARQDSKAPDFAGLQGQALALPASGQRYLHLFVERQAQANGKKLEEFFSRITSPENLEDAIDDVVDGVVQAAVIDRAGLEAYKRRKPGRFKRLKEVAHSQPLPPTVVVYYDATLDQSTLQRFREGLVGASQKEKGKMLLNLFRISGFEAVPSDFDQVVTEARKAYPPPSANNGGEKK